MVSCFNLLRGAESDPAVQAVGRVVTDSKKEDGCGAWGGGRGSLGQWRVACGTVTCHDPVVQAKPKTDDALCTGTSERMWKTAYEHV